MRTLAILGSTGSVGRQCLQVVDELSPLHPDRIQVQLRAHGGSAGSPTVMSCGSGVTACFGVLAARLAGMTEPLLYPGSYSDWSGAGMPIATGDGR